MSSTYSTWGHVHSYDGRVGCAQGTWRPEPRISQADGYCVSSRVMFLWPFEKHPALEDAFVGRCLSRCPTRNGAKGSVEGPPVRKRKKKKKEKKKRARRLCAPCRSPVPTYPSWPRTQSISNLPARKPPTSTATNSFSMLWSPNPPRG
jgi:hypothetical protein